MFFFLVHVRLHPRELSVNGLELEFQKQSNLLKCFIRMLCTKIFSKKLLFGKFCPPHTPWNSSSSTPQLHPHAPTIERLSSTPHFVERLTSTHTPTPVRWVFSLFFSSLTFAHFELCMYPIYQGKNLPHAGEAIPTSNISDLSPAKPIYGFGIWFVEEEHDWFGSGF